MAASTCLFMQGCPAGARDLEGCTALQTAATWNQIELVRVLEARGLSSLSKAEDGKTAMHIAAEQGWTELVQVHALLRRSMAGWSCPHARLRDLEQGWTKLMRVHAVMCMAQGWAEVHAGLALAGRLLQEYAW